MQKILRLNLKHWLNKKIRFFLLLLFLGYYGSITLFTHCHILNGVTIIHSHPFSSYTGNNPINHQHSANGYILIQLLSQFLTTVSFFAFSIEALKPVLRKTVLQKNDENFYNPAFLCSNGLRAPPLEYNC